MAWRLLRMIGARQLRVCAALAVVGLSIGTAAMLADTRPRPSVHAAATSASSAAPASRVDAAPDWTALTAFERSTLTPLREHWAALDTSARGRWIKIADRLQGRPESLVIRAQRRMAAWQQLTPEQRAATRAGYARDARFTAQERHARWLAYQARLGRSMAVAQGASSAAVGVQTSLPQMGGAIPLTPVSMPIPGERDGHSVPSSAPRRATGRDSS